MSDQPAPQPQAAYPDFPITAQGLRLLHQQIGKMFHQLIEKEVFAETVQKQHEQKIAALTTAFEQATTPPVDPATETPTEPTPMKKRAGGG